MDQNQLEKYLKGTYRTSKEIAQKFSLTEEETTDELKEYLDTGVIVMTIKGYMLTTDCHIFLGTIVLRKDNFAYVKPYGSDGGKKSDVRVAGKSLEGYMAGDKIYFQIDNWNNGTIVGLYKRVETVSGAAFKKGDNWFCAVKAASDAGIDVAVQENLTEKGIADGDLIKAKIISSSKDVIEVSFEEVLAKASDVGADISAIIAENDAPLRFPEEVLNEARAIPQTISDKDLEGRVDFRKKVIVTIDGADALDFDDAVSCEKITNGYQIGVYIADVSYYVQTNHPLDEEAQKRGCSIYVADRVVPMLPTELSNGICSLNPDVDRLVLSVLMNVDEAGNVYKYEIAPGVIHSHGRLTYKQVNDLFETKQSSLSEEINSMLFLMKEATDKIRARRERNGALDLDSTELKFVLDENGHPTDVVKRTQGKGENMIEDLMIIANVSVAKFLSDKDIPTLYRVHDNPPKEKLAMFIEFLKNIKLSHDFPKTVTSASLSHWFDSIEDEKVRFAVSGFLLRSLAKAKYSPDNTGHFGLAEEYYLHFTSPIRRYPDLIVHRTLRDYVFNQEKFDYKRLHNTLASLGLLTSEAERRADDIEHEVDDLESAKYMSNHINEHFKGVVDGITAKGMYLELENGIEGFLALKDIDPEQKWVYNETHMDIQGTERNETDRLPFYRLGSELDVVVDAVTMEDRTIHLETTKAMELRKAYAKYQAENSLDSEDISSRPDYSRFEQRSKYGDENKIFRRRDDYSDDYEPRRSFSDDEDDREDENYEGDERKPFVKKEDNMENNKRYDNSRDESEDKDFEPSENPKEGFSKAYLNSQRDDRGSYGDRRGGYRGGRSSYGHSDDRRGGFGGGRRPFHSDDRRSSFASKNQDSHYSYRQKDGTTRFSDEAAVSDSQDNAELTRFVANTDSQDAQEAKRKFYSDRPSSSRGGFRGGRSSFGHRDGGSSYSRGGYGHSDDRGHSSFGHSSRGGFGSHSSYGHSDSQGGDERRSGGFGHSSSSYGHSSEGGYGHSDDRGHSSFGHSSRGGFGSHSSYGHRDGGSSYSRGGSSRGGFGHSSSRGGFGGGRGGMRGGRSSYSRGGRSNHGSEGSQGE
jgi:ribonuclease R